MPYTINLTNGEILTTVIDGDVDTDTTSLALIGKNATSYGEYQNENFVKLLNTEWQIYKKKKSSKDNLLFF